MCVCVCMCVCSCVCVCVCASYVSEGALALPLTSFGEKMIHIYKCESLFSLLAFSWNNVLGFKKKSGWTKVKFNESITAIRLYQSIDSI